MDTSALPVNAIANNALFHSNSHISQMLPQIIHILRFCLVDSLPKFSSQLDCGQGCSMSTNLKVHSGDHDILDYCTFGLDAANDALNVKVDRACGKDHDQQNLSESTYNQIV